jgi:hypothetical protein
VINGANEGGATPGNTLTNNIQLISPTNTLTNTTVDFTRIFYWKAATQLTQTAAVSTNDIPVWRTGGLSDALTSAAAGGTAPAGVTQVSLQSTITITGLTLAAGATSSALTVTATNNVNTLSRGVNCYVQSYGGTTGNPIVTLPTLAANSFTFDITNVATSGVLNGNVVVNCNIDNGRP